MTGTGLLMIGGALLLAVYMVVAKRSRFLPPLPFGFLILYFAIRAIFQFIGHLPIVAGFDKWIGVATAIILSWAIIRLTFALLNRIAAEVLETARNSEYHQRFHSSDLLYGTIFHRFTSTWRSQLSRFNYHICRLDSGDRLGCPNHPGQFFSGLVLQMEHPFSIGDWITYGSHTGRVVGITWKSTRIITRDNVLVYLPNNELSNNILINYSKPDSRVVCRMHIGLEYGAPPNKVQQVILDVVNQHPYVLSNPRPQVRLISFDDFSIKYEILFWYENYIRNPQIKADLNNQIWYALRRNGINIPFPIRDVQHAHIERRHKVQERKRLSLQIRALLEKVPLLVPLSDEDREKIALEATIEDYGADELICSPGRSRGFALHYIKRFLRGAVRSEGAVAKKIATINKGDFFGEMSLLTGEARQATVKALEYATVIRVDKALFSTFLASNPDIADQLGAVMAQRQQELSLEANKTQNNLIVQLKLISRIKAFFGI